FPYELGNLENLLDLRADFNEITELSNNIDGLKNLKRLNLDNNKLNIFPYFRGFQDLEFWSMRNNPLTFLSGFMSIPNKLRVFNTKLSEIPIEVGQLIKLRTFNIGHNNLLTLPTVLGNLINLETLILSNNKLSEIPIENAGPIYN
ncbi:uncharacterized protein LOC143921873, partial [Arctopsyche grandis]|uniref:uncharacterized protein LOC143921873 n=1 Tax=Arctopsyche grandis TaxID=121162 RepID=UPI00406D7606